jgi:DNA polymerase III alpha subunit
VPPFVHLHVASGYSLRHGASSPAELVARAAELGQDALALTDRDGLYGAVRFVLACRDAGIAPILGVDLAVHPVVPEVPLGPSGALGSRVRRTAAGRLGSGPTLAERTRRTPARGGVEVDPGLPRVVLLARGRTGWASLCRVVSAAHLGLGLGPGSGGGDAAEGGEQGRRGAPVVTLATLAEHSAGLVVLLGPDSEPGRALHRRRPDLAAAALAPWQEVFGRSLAIEVVSHRARDRTLAVTDVDGARGRGLPLSSSAAARMLGFARERGLPAVLTNAVRHATREQAPVVDVLDAIRRLVPLDSRHLDRANGEGHLADEAAMRAVAAEVVSAARPSYFLTVADVVDLIRGMGCGSPPAGRAPAAWSTTCSASPGSTRSGTACSWSASCPRCAAALPDIDVDVESARRTEVYERILDRFGGERCACVSMMDTYRVRHAVRDVGAALGLPPGRSTPSPRPSRTSGPATPARPCRAARAARLGLGRRTRRPPASSTASSAWSSGSTGCRATSRCTRAACCCPTPRCSTAPRSRRAGWASR